MTPPLARALVKLEACHTAVAWARSKDRPRGWRRAWDACPDGSWLLWLAGRLCQPGDDLHRLVVLAVCDVAETTLVHVPAGETRPRKAIEAARAWARGEATIELVRAAARAAAEAAAWPAARSAEAAAEAAWPAEARTASLARSAEIVRARIPYRMIRERM